MTPDTMAYQARPDRLGTRIWDVRAARWHSAAHPNAAWMHELAVLLSVQQRVRDERRATRLMDAAREEAWTDERNQRQAEREGRIA